jgi:hypothetical protein
MLIRVSKETDKVVILKALGLVLGEGTGSARLPEMEV